MTPSLIDRYLALDPLYIQLCLHINVVFVLRRGIVTDEYRIEIQPIDNFRYNSPAPPLVAHQPTGSSEQIHKSKYYDNEVSTAK